MLAFNVRQGDHADGDQAQVPAQAASPDDPFHSIRSQAVVSGGSRPASSGPLASRTVACGGNGTGSAGDVGDAAHASAAARAPRSRRAGAVEGEHPVRRRHPGHRAVAEQRPGTADAQRVPVERQHRVGAGGLGRDREVAPLLRLAQPRRGGGVGRREAERRLRPRPRQRHPRPVPARVLPVRAVPDRVLAELIGDVLHLPEPEFLPLVDVDRAGQRHRQQRRRPRAPGAELQVDREAVEVPPPVQAERGIGPAVAWWRSGPRRGWTAPRWPGRRPAGPASGRSPGAAPGRPTGSSGTGS